ncbi:hypothetical protein Q5P01_000252 [Channa striata]|uniref:Uncharacterized protein n=1 Tax=Channa striata TaxID=64152 RepID=A0AA88LMR0_CHASR|nr:hypothetical protein Q5P01_000252 [Channa striata]
MARQPRVIRAMPGVNVRRTALACPAGAPAGATAVSPGAVPAVDEVQDVVGHGEKAHDQRGDHGYGRAQLSLKRPRQDGAGRADSLLPKSSLPVEIRESASRDAALPLHVGPARDTDQSGCVCCALCHTLTVVASRHVVVCREREAAATSGPRRGDGSPERTFNTMKLEPAAEVRNSAPLRCARSVATTAGAQLPHARFAEHEGRDPLELARGRPEEKAERRGPERPVLQEHDVQPGEGQGLAAVAERKSAEN